MEHSITHLFIYGSLRSGFQHPAYEYIHQYFEFVSDATVSGTLFDMGAYPAAIPVSAGNRIVGELYKIKDEDEFDWAIAQLDDYEGVDPEEGEEMLFKRALTNVLLSNGNEAISWIYWFNGDVTGKPVVSSGDVLKYMKDKQKG
jgi:gamma-glutamylcyclotransferase (GGCT)/AIG2-like uncharacterized protein YtfP